jgi:hypothetical protein
MHHPVVLVVIAAILLQGWAPVAHAEPRLVLVQPARLDPGLPAEQTAELTTELSAAVTRALARVNARQPSQAELDKTMRELKVTALTEEQDALRVARALRATQVLACEATAAGDDKVELKATLTHVDHPLSTEETATVSRAQAAAGLEKLVVLLLAPPATRVPSKLAPKAPPRAKSEKDPGSRPPYTAAALWVVAGPSIPLALGAEPLAVGFRVGLRLGFQIRATSSFTFTPELTLGYARWGFDDAANFLGDPLGGSMSAFDAQGGARAGFLLGPLEIWLAGHLGLCNVDREVEIYTDLAGSSFGVTWNLEGGLTLLVTRHLGVGLSASATRYVVGSISNTEVSPVGLCLGLDLKLTL